MWKEEWRIHSTLFGNIRFAFFPVLIAFMGFSGTLAVNVFDIMFTRQDMALAVHYLFMFFGVNVGAFGLGAREFMNRRFGQASLIAYSSRTLPVSERLIFAMMVAKDVAYYFLLWIIPLVLGFTLASPALHVPLSTAAVLLLTLSLSFLMGLSIVFFLSMLYARFGKLFIIVLIGVAVCLGMLLGSHVSAFPPFVYFLSHALGQVWVSLGLIIIPASLATVFATFDFPVSRNHYENMLSGTIERLSYFGRYSAYVAKDILDLRRSGGGLGKVLFSFLIPMSFLWVFLSFLTTFVPQVSFSVLLAIFLGIFSATVYTWLTEYDLFNQYLFLPVQVSTIIRSKIIAFCLVNTLSVLILIVTAILRYELPLLILSVLLFIITSYFALAITILYTGLSPSILFMDVRVILKYLATIIPFTLLLIFVYVFGTVYIAAAALLVLVLSHHLMKAAYRKWDTLPQQTF